MATTRTDETCQLIIRVNEGTTETPTPKNRTLNYIAPNTTDDNFKSFGDRLAALQTLPVIGIMRVDKAMLAEE